MNRYQNKTKRIPWIKGKPSSILHSQPKDNPRPQTLVPYASGYKNKQHDQQGSSKAVVQLVKGATFLTK